MKCPRCSSENTSDSRFCKNCATSLPVASEPLISQTLTLSSQTQELLIGSLFAGRYQVLGELGKGGMGRVYKVLDTKVQEEMALKLIDPAVAADKRMIERFKNELKFARQISHRNVCRMFDLNETEGTPFITMEYVPGEDLKSFIRRSGQLSAGKALSITKQVCEGLAEAHRLGVIHRDLKPSNIMIDREGNARIMDFGIARSLEAREVTRAGVMIGTPEYMSPEQVEGEDIDQRSDIYSLGVILYEMVTGKVPFEGATPLSIALKHKTVEPQNPKKFNSQIPEDLSLLILKCMNKDKAKRYQNSEEVISELNKIESGIPARVKALERRRPFFQHFFQTLRERKIIETLAAFIGGGWLILEAVHWILIDHYHLPEESLDITIISLLGVLICTLIWRFRGVEKKAKKIKIGFILISAVLFATIISDAFIIWKIEKPESKPGREASEAAHRQLTFTGNVSYPAISPDGKSIAYVTTETSGEQKVMVQDIASGQALEVFRASFCGFLRWPPDGSVLSFFADSHDLGAGIFIVSRLGGTPRRLEAGFLFSWSPDGSKFAHATRTSKKIQLRDKSTGSSASLPLKGAFIWLEDLDWSSSGNYILFSTRDDQDRYAIWTITSDGSAQQKVVEDNVHLSSPRWSPRGNAVYYLRTKEQTKELWKIPISPDSGKPIKSPSLILSGLQIGDYFTMTGDGKQLLYTRELRYSNLWLAEIRDRGKDNVVETKQLTTGTLFNSCPNISPDGRDIAFSRGDGKSANIFMMPLQGGAPKQITFLDSYSTNPVWSPDGQEIAFCSAQGGAPEVWKMSVSGGNPYRFAGSLVSGETFKLVWSPGQKILYQRPGHRNFIVLNPDSREENPLVKDDSVGWMFEPKHSSDGKKIVVNWNRGSSSGSSGLWLISLDDSSQRLLLKGSNEPIGWSSDDKCVYFKEQDIKELKIFMVSVENGQVKTLSTIPATSEMGQPQMPCLTSDGRKFVFECKKTLSDVWVVKDFDPEVK